MCKFFNNQSGNRSMGGFLSGNFQAIQITYSTSDQDTTCSRITIPKSDRLSRSLLYRFDDFLYYVSSWGATICRARSFLSFIFFFFLLLHHSLTCSFAAVLLYISTSFRSEKGKQFFMRLP